MQKERWLPVVGYESHYAISDRGRVRRIDSRIVGLHSSFLQPRLVATGYLQVALWSDRKRKDFYVHRLVALAFIPKPDGRYEVNHKDRVKSHNIVSNLEWVSHRTNMLHAFRRRKDFRKPPNASTVAFIIRSQLPAIRLGQLLDVCPRTIWRLRKEHSVATSMLPVSTT